MKKIFLLFSMALLSLTASAGRYYDTEAEAGDFALGINLNNGLINPVLNWGLGAKMQEWFHLSPKKDGLIQDMRGVQMSDTPLAVTKDGGQVDAITAATISSRAFLDALQRAYNGFKAAQSQGSAQTEAAPAATADSTMNTNTDNTEVQ